MRQRKVGGESGGGATIFFYLSTQKQMRALAVGLGGWLAERERERERERKRDGLCFFLPSLSLSSAFLSCRSNKGNPHPSLSEPRTLQYSTEWAKCALIPPLAWPIDHKAQKGAFFVLFALLHGKVVQRCTDTIVLGSSLPPQPCLWNIGLELSSRRTTILWDSPDPHVMVR